MIKSLFSLAAVVALAAPAHALTVVQWNFNSATPDANPSTGTTLPSTGTGTASLTGTATSTFASGDANGGSSDTATGDDSGWNLTTFPAQGTGLYFSGAQFAVSTVGYSAITISWDQRHSNTSARHVAVLYSLDGVNFGNLAPGGPFAATAGDTWFNGRTVDLSGIAGANNNPNFAFRIVSAFAPGTTDYAASTTGSNYSTSGTWRFDMVTVSAVPEPGTYALMLAGLAAVGFVARRRA